MRNIIKKSITDRFGCTKDGKSREKNKTPWKWWESKAFFHSLAVLDYVSSIIIIDKLPDCDIRFLRFLNNQIFVFKFDLAKFRLT